jgi:transcriptional antiterminator RfaH
MKRWYVLYTKPKEEERAKSSLELMGYKTYVPMIRVRKAKLKSVDQKEPMFPRYIFVSADGINCNLQAIKYARGVVDFIRFGGYLASVTNDIVESVEENEKRINGFSANAGAQQPKNGDRVSFVDGSFKDVDAIFFAKKSDERVVILTNLLRKSVYLEVGSGDIRIAK